MVVNPQQYMHQTVHTINKTYNSRFTVKEVHDAKNLDATQKWSVTNTNESISKYAEGVISFQWSLSGLYMSIRILSTKIWWAVLIICDGDAPSVKGKHNVLPWFRQLRVVEWIEGHIIII
jgi:hypothetical protein